jgi:hypothetical protein
MIQITQEDRGWRPAWAKSLQDPILADDWAWYHLPVRACGVAQMIEGLPSKA